jgi:hypothetical protein
MLVEGYRGRTLIDDPDRELTSQLDGVCGGTGETSGMDIEALAFLTLMGAAKSNQEDMKIIMQEVEHGSIGKSPHRIR